MSPCLKQKESVAHGWHRLMKRSFDAVEQQVRTLPQASERAEAVHEARKHLKRLRALYQLCREPLGKELCARETALLRDVARDLAAVRDIEVRLETLDDLIPPEALRSDARLHQLRRQWSRERDHLMQATARPMAMRGLIRSLQAARRSTIVLPIPQSDWPLLAHALTRAYRRAREGWLDVINAPGNSEHLHDWRKRVKILEHLLGILKPIHPKAASLLKRLHRFTECLGDEHDLYVLAQALRQAGPEFQKTPLGGKLRAQLRRERARLTRRALKLGEAFFEEKPREFVRRLQKWWEEWRAPFDKKSH